MMHDLVIGVAGSIIGAIICAIGTKVYSYINFYRNSEYSGEWEDSIPAKPDGTPEKHDKFIIRHNTRDNTITGTIERIYPLDQTTRNWVLNGVIDDGYFIASFWHRGPQKSNGCLYTKLTADNTFEGYYLEEHNGIVDQTPLALRKK